MNEGKETMKQIKNFYSMRNTMDKVKGQLKKKIVGCTFTRSKTNEDQ